MANDSSIDRVVAHLLTVVDGSAAGSRLPSSREVARALGVGPVTVQRALDRLVARGQVETRPGVGSFVAAKTPTPPPDTAWQDVALGADRADISALANLLDADMPGVLQMGAGYFDESLRADARLGQAMARAARRPGAWGKPPVRGIAELRAWFAGQTGADADDVLVTPAAQASLSAVLRAIAAPGDPVLFATPTYPGALATARSAGLVPIGVPADEHGVRPELAEIAFTHSGARAMYVQPTFANPDGRVLAADRRRALLDIADDHGAVLIEDDWARWLGHGRPVPPPLLMDDQHGHVVTICSLSKIAAPSLRVGAVIARGPLAARITAMRMVDDFFVSAPLQQAAVELVSAPSWKNHVRTLAAALAARSAALVDALHAALPSGCSFSPPPGGISLWLQLPAGLSDVDATREAALRKLFVLPGRYHEVNASPRAHLRLSVAALPEQQARVGAQRLGEAIDAAAG